MPDEKLLADTSKPLFYAEGQSVWRQATGSKNPDGSSNWSLGFKVCTVEEGITPASVAEMLTVAELQD